MTSIPFSFRSSSDSVESTHITVRKGEESLESLKITDLDLVATLGMGGFGRVELVKRITAKILCSEYSKFCIHFNFVVFY